MNNTNKIKVNIMKNGIQTIADNSRNRGVGYLRLFLFCLLATFSILTATESIAKSYSFTWTANPEPVTGYKLYYKKGGTAAQPFEGTGAVEGASPVNVGKLTTYTITGLDDNATYHFALTAYNGTDESGYSQIITVQPGTGQAPQILNIKAQ